MINNLYLIACIGKNNELGANNDLIWKFSNDMKFFKEKTINNTVIMGRKTYESIGGILPKRENIIITRNKETDIDNALIFNDYESVIKYINNNPNKTFYIIGGSSIYEYFLPFCKKLYLTEVNANYEANVYFPKFNKKDYKENILHDYYEDNTSYKIVEYIRK